MNYLKMLFDFLGDNYTVIHSLVVIASGFVIYMWSKKRIGSAESRLRNRVKKLKIFQSIRTTTPIDRPVQEAKETALESIEHRFSIIQKLASYSIGLIWLFVLIFPFLRDVPAAFISVFVAASGVLIGIAARPFIENLISGIVISFSRPIRIGDTVLIDNNYGTIEDITITHTYLRVWNWRRYIIPNSQMLSKEFINCTMNDSYQWAHVQFMVAYDTDLDMVKKIAIHTAAESKYFSNYEPPRFWVMKMDERGVVCWVAAWADNPMATWELENEIRTNLVMKFQSLGIKTHRVEIGSKGQMEPTLVQSAPELHEVRAG